MAAVPTETPSHQRLASTSKRLGVLAGVIATIAVIVTVVVAVVVHDSHPAFRCVPAEGVSSGEKASSSTNCSANTKTTGVGVTKPGTQPGAKSP